MSEALLYLALSVQCVTPMTKAPAPLVTVQVTRFIAPNEWVVLRPDGGLTWCKCSR